MGLQAVRGMRDRSRRANVRNGMMGLSFDGWALIGVVFVGLTMGVSGTTVDAGIICDNPLH